MNLRHSFVAPVLHILLLSCGLLDPTIVTWDSGSLSVSDVAFTIDQFKTSENVSG
jgi:hypothetical protein